MTIDLYKIILFVIMVLSAAAVSFLIPYLKQKLSEEQLNKAQMWLKMFCSAAETMLKTGAEKKQWVLEQMSHLKINLTPEQLDSCLEAVVRELTALGVIN